MQAERRHGDGSGRGEDNGDSSGKGKGWRNEHFSSWARKRLGLFKGKGDNFIWEHVVVEVALGHPGRVLYQELEIQF